MKVDKYFTSTLIHPATVDLFICRPVASVKACSDVTGIRCNGPPVWSCRTTYCSVVFSVTAVIKAVDNQKVSLSISDDWWLHPEIIRWCDIWMCISQVTFYASTASWFCFMQQETGRSGTLASTCRNCQQHFFPVGNLVAWLNRLHNMRFCFLVWTLRRMTGSAFLVCNFKKYNSAGLASG